MGLLPNAGRGKTSHTLPGLPPGLRVPPSTLSTAPLTHALPSHRGQADTLHLLGSRLTLTPHAPGPSFSNPKAPSPARCHGGLPPPGTKALQTAGSHHWPLPASLPTWKPPPPPCPCPSASLPAPLFSCGVSPSSCAPPHCGASVSVTGSQ